jgi:hypothetical protein
MSKWCNTCHRNEITGEWRSCNRDCPVFGRYFEDLAEIVVSIKEILAEKSGTSDSQEFGLSYNQVINYLDEIERKIV